MKNFVVIDTNVVVSGIMYNKSVPGMVLDEILFGNKSLPICSDDILNEYVEVLKRDKFHFNNKQINVVINRFVEKSIFLDTYSYQALKKCSDSKDQKFYNLYRLMFEYVNQYTYLLTGNLKHYPSEDNILSPRKMCEVLNLA